MVHFVEPLATQQLWHWLETEYNWRVDSEVDTGNGRIDLACETPDGRYIGIELKGGSGLSWSGQLSEQVWRYIDSERFDEVYFASPSIEKVEKRLESSTVEPLVPVISQAGRKLRAGVQEGLYTADEVLEQIDAEIDDSILSAEFSDGRGSVRTYIRRHVRERTEHSLEPISISDGMREISRSVFPSELGLIEVPLPLQGGYLRSPRMALTPGEIHKPSIVREASQLARTDTPTFARDEEPWIRHAVWEQFGGLPEGSIPNVMESERFDRPIDLVAFEGDWDPVEIRDTGEGAIIGVEAKGRGSFAPERVRTQLDEFLEAGIFSQLYLAVPEPLEEQARDVVEAHEEFDPIGILSVDSAGSVTPIREAASLSIEHDGFKHGTELVKTGYGDVRIPNGRDVESPFVLSDWRDPLTDDAGDPVVWDYDPRETDYVIHDIDDLEVTEQAELSDSLKTQAQDASTARAYLLTGYSAAPYVDEQGRRKENQREPKFGYVRLSVTDFEAEDGEYALDLHFGAGGWEGGYICLIGDQVEGLVSLLSSLERIPRGQIPGQGQYIDLETFRWDFGQNYEFKLGAEENEEQLVALGIEAVDAADGMGARLRLGEDLTQGVEVMMTHTQRIDFLRALRIMRYGRSSELPGEGSGYQRIGPDGNDTWDRGTGIEKQHNPDELLQTSANGGAREVGNPSESTPTDTLDDEDSQDDSVSLFDQIHSLLK